jgi:hypothetical protein
MVRSDISITKFSLCLIKLMVLNPKKTWKPTSYSCWTTTHTSFQKPHEMKLTNMALSPVSEH